MKLIDLIQGQSRASWSVRLLMYIAFVATIALAVQFLHIWIL